MIEFAAPAQQQQQQQQPVPGPTYTQLVVTTAAALAVAVAVPVAVSLLAREFLAAQISPRALEAALTVTMSMPPEHAGFFGSATARVHRLNHLRTAQFVVHSARRLQADITRARSENRPVLSALMAAVSRERRYYGQHLLAGWNRQNAAAAVDSASMTYGRLLGWYSVLDSRTSPECRRANGHNFYADQMPAIGYPGMVHPHCRCSPGPPVPGAPLVGQPGRARAARQPAYA